MDKNKEIPKNLKPDSRNNQLDNQPQDPQRRNFLKGVLAGLGAIATGGLLSRKIPSDAEVKAGIPPLPRSESTPIPIKGEEADISRREIPGVVERVSSSSSESVKPVEEQSKLSEERDIETILSVNEKLIEGMSQQEKENFVQMVLGEIGFIRGLDRYEDILAKCAGYQTTIHQVVSDFDYSQEFKRSILPDYMDGIIFAESMGDPNIGESIDGAQGLFQIMPRTAEFLSNSYRINIDNIKKERTNTALAAANLDLTYKELGRADLCIWAYNLGQGSVSEAVGKKLGLVDYDYVKALDGIGKYKTSELISENGLNFVNLVESPFVREQTESKRWKPEHKIYLARVVAAHTLINSETG